MIKSQMTLGLHFSSRTVGTVVVRTPSIWIERHIEITRASAENLPLAVESILKEAEIPLSGLSEIGVVVGPGALTPLRLSVATAQTMGLVAHVPVVGICGFEVILRDGWRLIQIVVLEGRPGRCLIRGYVQVGDEFKPLFKQVEKHVDHTVRLVNRFNARVGVVTSAVWVFDRLHSECPGADVRYVDRTGSALVALLDSQRAGLDVATPLRINYGYAPV